MTILFLHGLTIGGVKPTYLKDHGHTLLNPKLPDNDFDEAVWIAQPVTSVRIADKWLKRKR